jgi:hypothetical protein
MEEDEKDLLFIFGVIYIPHHLYVSFCFVLLLHAILIAIEPFFHFCKFKVKEYKEKECNSV